MFTKLNEDPRTASAREYLDDATYARPVTTLPPTVLMRELAETRRQLGIMLTVLDGQALTEALRGTIGQALTDAVSYRTDGASGPCTDCDVHPAGLCDDHTIDVVLIDAYVAYARDLGIEVPR
jgi:hypothetical protein